MITYKAWPGNDKNVGVIPDYKRHLIYKKTDHSIAAERCDQHLVICLICMITV
jgi:hypothetical protein